MLNQPRYKGATILLARKNFGCGSSREHAPWALMDYGFRCVIAPSFGDIFFNNCFKNGLLPVVLREDEVDQLFYDAAAFPGFRLTIDLESQTVSTADGSKRFRFDDRRLPQVLPAERPRRDRPRRCATRTRSAPSRRGARRSFLVLLTSRDESRRSAR